MATDSFPVVVAFEVWSPPPPADFKIIITGSIPQLGNWFTEKPIYMTQGDKGVWRTERTVKSTDVIEYKFACYSEKQGRCVGYEQGPNRELVVNTKLAVASEKDAATGLAMVTVKDVWSAAQNKQGRSTSDGASKEQVKEFQKKERDLEQSQKELAKKLSDLQGKYDEVTKSSGARITELETEVAQAKARADEIQNKALSGASAAANEAANALQKQLDEQQAAAKSAQEALAEQLEEAKAKLQSVSDELHEVEQQRSSLQGDLTDAQESSKEHISTITAVNTIVASAAASVQDEGIKQQVTDSASPVDARLEALVRGMAAQGGASKEALRSLMGTVRGLQAEMDGVRQSVKEAVQAEAVASAEAARAMLTPFVQGKDEEIQTYVERYQKQFDLRRNLANEIVDLKGKIRVYGRARPFNKRESEAGHSNVVAFPETNRILIGLGAERYMQVNDVAEGLETEQGQSDMEEVKTYELDHIFPPTTTQEEVFEEVQHLIGSVMDGYNVTLFAYGQTGSGKTHTMDGNPEMPGLTYRSLDLFFGESAKKDKSAVQMEVSLQLSMLEIYNEEVRDLLLTDPSQKKKLDVRQSADGGSHIPGLTQMPAASIDEAFKLMDLGRTNRKTSSTKMNATSSRSHMVFTAYVSATHPVTKDTTHAKLHLVDLAGSERVGKTGASGETLKEAQAINKSLSALGDVIASLTSSNQAHVPYRNSKLTFLLKDSLCGNSRTAMFIALSPSSDNYWETISTLNFGARAASVELGQVQKKMESGEAGKLRAQMAKLQDALSNARNESGGASEQASSLQARIDELEKDAEKQDRMMKALQKQKDELAGSKGKEEQGLQKKLDKAREDSKAKDARIAELEDKVKQEKKNAMAAGKGKDDKSEATSKEASQLRKQLKEAQAQIKAAEVKVTQAETKLKKSDGLVKKAEDAAKEAKAALAKAGSGTPGSGRRGSPNRLGKIDTGKARSVSPRPKSRGSLTGDDAPTSARLSARRSGPARNKSPARQLGRGSKDSDKASLRSKSAMYASQIRDLQRRKSGTQTPRAKSDRPSSELDPGAQAVDVDQSLSD